MSTTTSELFHQRLSRLRREKGLTAKAMARAIDVADSTYRDWEEGRGLKLPPLQQISQVFAISVTELVTGTLPETEDTLRGLAQIENLLRELRVKIASRS